LRRVIYVIPYTSVIEQNARVFASVFGAENVLEHHSLAGWRKSADESTCEGIDSVALRWKLAAENWDAPFVVTTNVQFFEGLHAHRPSAVRKIHRILDAVVLFDECQTFPPGLLQPTLATLRALQALGRGSLVFCTATQPAFDQRGFFAEGFPEIREIIPPDLRLHARPEFTRTRIRRRTTAVSIAQFAEEFSGCHRALAVVNTKHSARKLFAAAADILKNNPSRSTPKTTPDAAAAANAAAGLVHPAHSVHDVHPVHAAAAPAGLYHLSTAMCPAHRQAVMDAVRIRLASPECSCLLVSTQLIEAGVDCDFPKLYRDRGPLDSILQAAGRCNREGRLTDAAGQARRGEVEVIHLADSNLPDDAYERATLLAAKFLPATADVDADISPEKIRQYFRELYQGANRDEKGIAYQREQQNHRAVGERYRWIDEDEPTVAVLAASDEISRAWIAALDARPHEPPSRREWRVLGPFCVNLRASAVERGIRAGALRCLRNGVVVTQPRHYDPCFGYTLDV
jgi:CRISPR-associated endonuclease/helicase Cas3